MVPAPDPAPAAADGALVVEVGEAVVERGRGRDGPPRARVTATEVRDELPLGEQGFAIR